MNLRRQMLKLENTGNRFMYKLTTSSFKKEIPVLDDDRSSFEELFLFLLKKAMDSRYDVKTGNFRKGVTLQRSVSGLDSDLYELMARTFIGTGYYLMHREDERLLRTYAKMISNGCNPVGKRYWGKILSNQILVENAWVITGLLLNRERLWNKFTIREQDLFLRYIEESMSREFVMNNWQWFKMFHYIALECLGRRNCQRYVRDVATEIDLYYKGDGWYNDGNPANEFRYDGYNSWIFHYFALLFCLLADDRYRDIKDKYRERFSLFKKSYLLCFNDTSLPLVWGRSLLYRFSMLDCFGPAIHLGLLNETEMRRIKRLTVRTVNNFFERGILDSNGMLTLGYTVASQGLLEEYSGDGSPYFVFKIFSFLMLEDSHPFWKERIDQTEDVTRAEEMFVRPCNLYLRRESRHNILINAGMNSRVFPDRYNRFAYSNEFPMSMHRQYPDNLFVFRRDGKRFTQDTLLMADSSNGGVMHRQWAISGIESFKASTSILPMLDGYILINRFINVRPLNFVFTGFNVPRNGSVSFRRNPGLSEVSSGPFISRLKLIGNNKGRTGAVAISAKFVITGMNVASPYFAGCLPGGETCIIFCVQASCHGQIEDPQIDVAPESIKVTGTKFGTKTVYVMEKNDFYVEGRETVVIKESATHA
jgi:hypothetical protein